MAKIVRQNHKVFGDTGSTDNFAKFGSLVAGSALKTKDIDTIQSLPAWDEGFQSAVYGGNKNLLLEDLNAWCYEHSRQVGYLMQAGVAEWDVATTYYKGSIVQRTDGGDATAELYASLTDDNVGNALPVQTDNANWRWINPPQVPPGTSLDFMGIDMPSGFLAEDGTAYARASFAALFAAITRTTSGNITSGLPTITGLPTTTGLAAGHYISGVGIASGARILTVDGPTQVTMTLNATSTQTPGTIVFGPHPLGDGATTFNVPDTRRRVTVGAGGAGTSTLGAGTGAVGGAETHTLVTGEIPAHTHVTGTIDPSAFAGGGNGAMRDTQGGVTGSTGGGGAHNNMQPSLVVVKMIKT